MAKTASPKAKKVKKKAVIEEMKIMQRQTWATDLHVQGLSYRRIARRMKELRLVPPTYSQSLAFKDVRDAMARTSSDQKELALHNLYLDLRRYDELFEKAWALALPRADMDDEEAVDPPPDPAYFGIVMAILSKRETLLNYKSLWAAKEKSDVYLNVNFSSFTTGELLETQRRLQAGEDPNTVITDVQQQRSRIDRASE